MPGDEYERDLERFAGDVAHFDADRFGEDLKELLLRHVNEGADGTAVLTYTLGAAIAALRAEYPEEFVRGVVELQIDHAFGRVSPRGYMQRAVALAKKYRSALPGDESKRPS